MVLLNQQNRRGALRPVPKPVPDGSKIPYQFHKTKRLSTDLFWSPVCPPSCGYRPRATILAASTNSAYTINGVAGPAEPPWRLWWSSHISVYNINGVTGPPVPPWRLWWSSSVYTSASKNQRASIIKTSVAKNTCYWHFKYAAMERCELTD